MLYGHRSRQRRRPRAAIVARLGSAIRLLAALALLASLAACGSSPQGPALETFRPAVLVTPPRELPLDAVLRYQLELTAKPLDNSLSGQVSIRYQNQTQGDLREVYLRLCPNLPMYGGKLDVSRATVDGREVPFVVGAKNASLKVPLPHTLAPQKAALLVIDFALTYPEMKGDYDFFGVRDGVTVLPDFYPMVAPLIDGEWRLDPSPGFGDAALSDLAFYDIEVSLPSGYQAIAPGKTVGTTTTPAKGVTTYHIITGLLRNIGLVIGQGYEAQTLQVGAITITSQALPQDLTTSRAALTHAAGALAYYQDNLAPYPDNHLLLVRVPLRQATVHLSGMILLNSALYGEKRDSLEQAVVDGVARQWWGLRLASDPIRDAWLDESLATYSTYMYLRETHGSAAEAFPEAWQATYADLVKSGQDGPLAQPLANFGGSAHYEALVYNKGPLFWQELEKLLGQSGLLTIMRELQRQSFGRVLDTAGLLATLNQLAGAPATDLAQKWVLGK